MARVKAEIVKETHIFTCGSSVTAIIYVFTKRKKWKKQKKTT